MVWRRGVPLLLAAVMAILALIWQSSDAGPSVLTGIDLQQVPGRSEIHIGFNLPLSYLSHSPAGPTDNLQIRLRLLSRDTDDVQAAAHSESLGWKASRQVPLQEVRYEGRDTGGPTLTINAR